MKELRLEDHVTFIGEMSYEVIQHEYANADIYIQLSKVEGMSNAILEAMSSGLPVITTNVGGASTLIENNGFLIEKVSVEAVITCVKQYINNPSLIRLHSQQSRVLAEQFSFRRIAHSYLSMMSSSSCLVT